jgi:hypothetical protein
MIIFYLRMKLSSLLFALLPEVPALPPRRDVSPHWDLGRH